MNNKTKTKAINPGPTKIRLDHLLVESPGQNGTAVVNIEYRANDQYLELDFRNRTGQTAVSIRFEVVGDKLVAKIEYAAWTKRPEEELQLIEIG